MWCYGQGKFRVRIRIRVRVGFGLGLYVVSWKVDALFELVNSSSSFPFVGRVPTRGVTIRYPHDTIRIAILESRYDTYRDTW